MKLASRFWANMVILGIGISLVIVGSSWPEIRPSAHEAIVIITLCYLAFMALLESVIESEGKHE